MPQPHDRFFKFVFGEPQRAAELLSLALPPELSQRVDFARLRPVKGTFVPPELRESSTDLLFEVQASSVSEAEPSFLVYLLFEHKSAPDPTTVLQLLGYLVRIWHPYRVKGVSKLPHIIPIIIYHGSIAWQVPVEFGDYFRGTPAFGLMAPKFRPLLVDLAKLSQMQLEQVSPISHSALAAFRYAAAGRESLLT